MSRALLDADHLDHDRAGRWADAELVHGSASSPLTENGFVRIISQPRYPSPVSPLQAVALLRATRSDSDHEFWPCDRTVLDPEFLASDRIHSGRQLTDAYLLALAADRGGRFVTFDRRIAREVAPHADEENLTIL